MKRFIHGIALAIIMLLAMPGPGTQASAAPQRGDAPNATPGRRWDITTVDNTYSVGAYNTAVLHPDTGQVLVAHAGYSTGALRLAYTADPVGSGSCANGMWECLDLARTSDAGTGLSFAYSISTTWGMTYKSDGHLVFYAGTTPCYTCGVATTVDLADFAGDNSSLKLDWNLQPHIAYRRDAMYLYYAHRIAGNCSGFQCDLIDSLSSVNPSLSLDLTATALPRIAYRGSAGDLKLASRVSSGGNCGPSNTWRCDVIDSGSFSYISLYVPKCIFACSDTTRIAYYDITNARLKYAHPVTSGGNCGPSNTWQCDAIAITGLSVYGSAVSMAVRNNTPTIAYVDATDLTHTRLKVARYVVSGGNCGPSSSWQCDMVDDGVRGAINHNVGTWASVVVNSAGQATIAYRDAYDNILLVAREFATVYLPAAMR